MFHGRLFLSFVILFCSIVWGLRLVFTAYLPLILILSVYTDFLPLEFGKIQIFFFKIWQNTDFFFRNAEGFPLYFFQSYRFVP